MELLLIRHGVAEALADGGRDADRELTAAGRSELEQSLPGLRSLGVAPLELWTSPWRRAVQTGEILSVLSKAPPALFQALAEVPTPALLGALVQFSECRGAEAQLALIGHQPWLGSLCRWLTRGRAAPVRDLPVPKGGLLWLSGSPEPGGMALQLLCRPRHLIALGSAKA